MIQETLLGPMKEVYEAHSVVKGGVDLSNKLLSALRIETDGGIFVYRVSSFATAEKYGAGFLVCLSNELPSFVGMVTLQGSVGFRGKLHKNLLIPEHYLQFEQLSGKNTVMTLQSSTPIQSLSQI